LARSASSGQPPDTALVEARLGAGERNAILLAQELDAAELIIDELRGRQEVLMTGPKESSRTTSDEDGFWWGPEVD